MKWLLRILIAVIVFYGAYQYALVQMKGGLWLVILPIIALSCLAAVFLGEIRGFKLHPMAYAGGLVGTILGLIIGSLFGYVLLNINESGIYLFILVNTTFAYLGYTIGLNWGKEISQLPIFRQRSKTEGARMKILDTSVIIDGRIADICEAGFIEGTIVAPQFILNELQHIADSPDPLKRARGRRGLDILNKLRKSPGVKIEVMDIDFPKIREVDSKLIALAREIGADILTNDFNLNKIAQLQGVNVLNINQLANAVKPIVLPGETLTVNITRPGKERGQGVAYLDDGTMVVVEQGESLINQSIEVTVTSILQTPAGRMIFGQPKNHASA
ncbi:MAG TPA: TRAM domain-containing protein [Deltaproteobacteria bacterium]|nr:TRAM domain-containing protein [Deltaproteobacteria bacterium]HOM28446.1 TRAM domain-containing protein [Deltaproteobacteria bacterium]HPP79677.1 TRAM domain-containing protein [Deltaproteobacteria bacterium]